MKITENDKVGEVVAMDYRTASVFKNYKIDFCCQGNRSIGDALKGTELIPTVLISELNAVLARNDNATSDMSNWPLDLLADYIEKIHHSYVESQLPVISSNIDKLVIAHGEKHPELAEIREEFASSSVELLMHMQREEQVLFPLIREMVKDSRAVQKAVSQHSIKTIINGMMEEHIIEGERFKRIRELSDNYTLPADGCMTYRLTLSQLDDFETDLHRHIHLENNILFPRAIKLENALFPNGDL